MEDEKAFFKKKAEKFDSNTSLIVKDIVDKELNEAQFRLHGYDVDESRGKKNSKDGHSTHGPFSPTNAGRTSTGKTLESSRDHSSYHGSKD